MGQPAHQDGSLDLRSGKVVGNKPGQGHGGRLSPLWSQRDPLAPVLGEGGGCGAPWPALKEAHLIQSEADGLVLTESPVPALSATSLSASAPPHAVPEAPKHLFLHMVRTLQTQAQEETCGPEPPGPSPPCYSLRRKIEFPDAKATMSCTFLGTHNIDKTTLLCRHTCSTSHFLSLQEECG